MLASPTGIASLPRAVFAPRVWFASRTAEAGSKISVSLATPSVFRCGTAFYYIGNETWISLTTLGLAVLVTDKFEPGAAARKCPRHFHLIRPPNSLAAATLSPRTIE